MKKLAALILALSLLAPVPTSAAYGLTQSILLAAASTQSVSASDSASLSQTGNQTHEGWVKFTTLPTSGNGMNIFSKYTASGSERAISMVYENNAGTLRFHARTSANGTDVLEGTLNHTLSTDTWYFIRFVYSTAGTIAIYVDNTTTAVGTISSLSTSIKDNAAAYNIGVQADISGNLNARVSLWRVWSGSHTTNDKCTVYGTATTNMQAEWSLNNVLTDASGNSNTLTNNNSATFGADVPSTCATATILSIISDFFMFGDW